MSSIVNKIKDVIHDKKHSEPEGAHGPHNTRAANAADPRVDSDRDGSHHVGGTTGGRGNYGQSDYTQGTSHTHNTQLGGDGPAPYTAGPHRADALNKVDPRIDSDRDGSRNAGMNQSQGYSGTGSHAAGPHRSDALNKVDPRVDSDRDGSRAMGLDQHNAYQHEGITGTGIGSSAQEGTYGRHNTRAANALDPRVDSDRDGSNTLGGTRYNGPAPHTAGPHKSDMLNKADPRVDADLDGSRTYGNDKTYAQS